MEDIWEAVAIINRSLKSGKLLVEYKRWEQIDFKTRAIALSLFDQPRQAQKCDKCGKLKSTAFTPNITMFGIFWECEDCMLYDPWEIARYNRYIRDIGGLAKYKDS